MRYIRRIRLEGAATDNEHIVRVRWSEAPTDPLTDDTRGQTAWDIDYVGQEYVAYNDSSGDSATVVTRTSRAGVRYLATMHDGRETADLLSLPQF